MTQLIAASLVATVVVLGLACGESKPAESPPLPSPMAMERPTVAPMEEPAPPTIEPVPTVTSLPAPIPTPVVAATSPPAVPVPTASSFPAPAPTTIAAVTSPTSEPAATATASPIRDLNEVRLVNDAVGETDIVILASSKSSDARVFERKGRQFALDSDEQTPAVPKSIIDQDGQTWRVFDVGLIAPDGEILERLPSYVSFWFGWYAFHPDTLLYEPN